MRSARGGNPATIDRFDLLGADLPDASRANEEALRFFHDLLRAKSAKNVDATMQFFSRETFTYADGTLGFVFKGWEALHGAYSSMMPGWGDGESYPVMVWGELENGDGSALVHLVNTPEMFGGEARIFASVDVRRGRVVRWVDYWDSRAFSESQFLGMSDQLAFPSDFGEHRSAASAAPTLIATAEAFHLALTGGSAFALGALLHPDVTFEDVALGTARRGLTAVAEHLTAAAVAQPFGRGAQLRRVVGGKRGGAYEWRAANGRPGITCLSIDGEGGVLRIVAAYDHRAFAGLR